MLKSVEECYDCQHVYTDKYGSEVEDEVNDTSYWLCYSCQEVRAIYHALAVEFAEGPITEE